MKVRSYLKFAMCDYNVTICDNPFRLGEVVINKDNEIGVIIQKHNNNELRTDVFGNCDVDSIRLATEYEVRTYRPKLSAILKIESQIYSNNILDSLKLTQLEKLYPKFASRV